MLTWTQRRQFTVFAVALIAAILVLAGLFVYFFSGQADKVEVLEGADFSILWARFFKLRDGFVDLSALVENPNNLSAGKFKYSFKIYDSNNILISVKEGESYARPGEKFVLFESNVAVFQRTPARVILDIENIVWEKDSKKEFPVIDILGTERFLEDIFPRLVLTLKNNGQKTYESVEATVVLWTSEDETAGVSRTLISNFKIDEERSITFTWPEAISGVLKVEAFFRLK